MRLDMLNPDRVIVTLSRRNLLTLLAQLDLEGPASLTLLESDTLRMTVYAEPDAEHYRQPGLPPDVMSESIEQYIETHSSQWSRPSFAAGTAAVLRATATAMTMKPEAPRRYVHSQCLSCWLASHLRWTSRGRLVADTPSREEPGELKTCCSCGAPTDEGIVEFSAERQLSHCSGHPDDEDWWDAAEREVEEPRD